MKKSRSNLKVLSHIAVLALVLVIAVVATFSWYNRSTVTETGYLLKYSQSGNVNGSGGEIHTYAGTNNDGVVTYSTTEVSETSGGISTEPGSVNYFKTVITDESNTGESMVSLYLEGLSYTKSLGNSVKVGIIQPEKTYKKYTSTLSGNNYNASRICLIDNVYVENNGTVEVYWFIEINKNLTTTGSINLGTLHLVYN